MACKYVIQAMVIFRLLKYFNIILSVVCYKTMSFDQELSYLVIWLDTYLDQCMKHEFRMRCVEQIFYVRRYCRRPFNIYACNICLIKWYMIMIYVWSCDIKRSIILVLRVDTLQTGLSLSLIDWRCLIGNIEPVRAPCGFFKETFSLNQLPP